MSCVGSVGRRDHERRWRMRTLNGGEKGLGGMCLERGDGNRE